MGMYNIQYGTENESMDNAIITGFNSVDARETLSGDQFERTEELPEQRDDGETKKTFRERGGVPYIRNASLLESEEFSVMNTEGGKRLSLKNEDTKVGLYSVDEDGNNKTIIKEDGTMPRVEEIYQILVDFMEQTNDAIDSTKDDIEDIKEYIDDIEDRLDALEATP